MSDVAPTADEGDMPALIDLTSNTATATTTAATENTTTDTAADEVEESSGAKQNYYFFKSTPEAERLKFAPQLIDTTTAAASVTASTSATGLSAWNSAGTYEERDITAYALANFAKHLLNTQLTLTTATAATATTASAVAVVIDKLQSITGESSIIFSRGKKKLGYDLSIKLAFTVIRTVAAAATEIATQETSAAAAAAASTTATTGTITISELADSNDLDDLEFVFRIDCASAHSDSDNIRKQLSSSKHQQTLKNKIQLFINELKEQ